MKLAKFLIYCTVTIFGGQPYACKLAAEASDLKAFLASQTPNKVVFIGKVQSANADQPSPEGVRKQIINFNANRWWIGQASEHVTAMGSTRTAVGTSCEGAFDFTAKPTEIWLVVGHQKDGVVYPSGQLSQLLIDGQLPPDIDRLLDSQGK